MEGTSPILVVVRAVRRRFWLLVAVSAAALGTVYVHNKSHPEMHAARVQFRYRTQTYQDLPLAHLVSQYLGGEWSSELEEQIEIVKSQEISRRTLVYLGIVDEKEMARTEIDSQVKSLQESTSVERVANTNMIEVGVTSGSPERAMAIANGLLDVYVEYDLEIRRKAYKGAREAYQTEIDRTRRLIEKLDGFSDSARLHEQLESALETEGGQVASLRENLRRIVEEFRSRRDRLLEKYAATHRLVVEATAVLDAASEIDQTERKDFAEDSIFARRIEEYGLEDAALAKKRIMAAEDGLARKKRDFEALQRKFAEAALDDDLKPLLGNTQGLRVRELENDLELHQKRLSELKKALSDVEIQLGKESSGVEVLERALSATRQTYGDVRTSYAFALLLAIVGTGGIAVWIEVWRRTHSRPAQVERALGVNVLADFSPLPRAGGGGSGPLLVEEDAPVRDQYRLLKFSLEARLVGAGPTVLTVTSSAPREGTSTVLANLGLAFASLGTSTLLLDGHSRGHDLALPFGATFAPSWNDLLTGRVPLGPFVQSTRHENLSLLCPAASRDPGGLDARLLADSLVELRERFGIILVDAPPSTRSPEALVFGRVSDGALVVYRTGHTRGALLAESVKLLSSNSVRLLGVVMNRHDSSR